MRQHLLTHQLHKQENLGNFFMKPSTEELKEKLQELVTKYNETLRVQNEYKEQIIATNAVIQDRTNGDTVNNSSDYSED